MYSQRTSPAYRRRSPIWCLFACALFLNAAGTTTAQEAGVEQPAGRRWAVIFVGLPGDDEHAAQFTQTADAWQQWLSGSLQFPSEQVLRFPAPTVENDKPTVSLTAETMKSALDDVRQKLQPNDTLWILTLGHGHYDGKRAWFHVAGRDPSDEDLGRWMSNIRCREQVIWLTQSSSGWFVKPLSRPGRIVIAATAADDEANETEFPHALAEVGRLTLEKLDADHDQKVSVAELFAAVLHRVHERFQSDKRLPTEHAQLDDNGDGRGSEKIELAAPPAAPGTTPNSTTMKTDGELARRSFVPH